MPVADLTGYLRSVRRRWQRVRVLRAWTISALAAGLVAVLALAVQVLLAPGALASAWLWSGSLFVAFACLASLLRVMRRRPTDHQVARLVEERCPDLDDTLVTAVSIDEAVPTPMASAVVADAVRRLQRLDLDRVIPSRTVGRASLAALATTLVLVVAWAIALAPAVRGVRLTAFFLMPDRFGLVVTPGNARVPAGRPIELRAQLPVVAEGAVPSVMIDDGERKQEVAMERQGREFALSIARVERDFRYTVVAAGVTSPEYVVTAIRPPRVERVDLHYEYPASFKMNPRDEQNGGDMYGPVGTRVRVSIQADKELVSGELTLPGGAPVPLTARGAQLVGELTIAKDASYRIAMADADGLKSGGDVEYFIRTLDDRPPSVRVTQPGSDRRATPLEEVSIEARADDDFGVVTFDLVYSVKGQAERVTRFAKAGAGLSVSGKETIYLEDLGVQPGDFVTYYARATDVSRGKPSTEARSDMFFLEVAPFDQEFVEAEGQSGGGGGDPAISDMIDAQKRIITATWGLDRRIRDSGGRPGDDIKAVAKAQGDLRRRTLAAAAQAQRAADVRRRQNGTRPPAGPVPLEESDDAVGRAADAMLNAERHLEASRTSPAMPFEMTALNELMRADADVRRREIQGQQTAGGGRGENRQQQDLSSLFDKELARQQQTNSETQRSTSEARQATGQSSPELDKVRDLVKRQEALNREQELRSGGPGSEADRRRQLERLTRDQLNLKQQTDDLARQIGQQEGGALGGGRGPNPPGGRGSDRESRRSLEQIAEDMQAAANELRQPERADANARGEQALARLRDLEQQLAGATRQSRQRQLGDLQMEARQLADAQRELNRIGGRQGRAATGQAGPSSAPGDQQRKLADRAERLEQTVQRLAEQAGRAGKDAGAALGDAAQELTRARVAERMRGGVNQAEGEKIARDLERASGQLGAAAAGESDTTRRLTEELSRLGELRERLDALDREVADSSGPGNLPKGTTPQNPPRDQKEANGDPWKDARELLEDLKNERALGVSPEGGRFSPGRSAPGTESWKQDVARWDALKVQLRAAIDRAEASVSARLRGQRAQDRLNAGASQSVPESYRRLVERYYRALAGGARP